MPKELHQGHDPYHLLEQTINGHQATDRGLMERGNQWASSPPTMQLHPSIRHLTPALKRCRIKEVIYLYPGIGPAEITCTHKLAGQIVAKGDYHRPTHPRPIRAACMHAE